MGRPLCFDWSWGLALEGWPSKNRDQLGSRYIYHGPPKPTCLEVFIVNNLVFRWPKPFFFPWFIPRITLEVVPSFPVFHHPISLLAHFGSNNSCSLGGLGKCWTMGAWGEEGDPNGHQLQSWKWILGTPTINVFQKVTSVLFFPWTGMIFSRLFQLFWDFPYWETVKCPRGPFGKGQSLPGGWWPSMCKWWVSSGCFLNLDQGKWLFFTQFHWISIHLKLFVLAFV